MVGFFVALVVDAAACHDQYVAVVANVEIVVDHLRDPCFRDDHGNVDGLVLRAVLHINVDAGFVRFRFDGDIFRVLPSRKLTVLADIVCAFGNTVQIGDLFEQSPADVFVVHAVTSAHYRLFRTYGGRTGGIPQLAADLVERTVDLRQDLVRCAAPR